jgi:hypothetical protein
VHFAGETARAIVKLEEGVGVLGSQLRTKIAGVRTRIRQRNCDIQNIIATMHNTVNHLQRLALTPDGQKPGELARAILMS